jgi:glycosyltransferase involved in cell wall biosynthesis
MLKLSIITINYNNLEGLKRTVESVINQTWKEFEYIVIDGGSTDGSAAYVESQSEHIDYWVSEPDKGIYNAMNKGILRATGEYLLFLNSGDHMHSCTVLDENHFHLVNQDLIYFNLEVMDKKVSYIKQYPDQLDFSFFLNDSLPHAATFIKTYLFDMVGTYNESLEIVSDWEFFIESVCKLNCSYKRVDATLTTFNLDGMSSDLNNKSKIYEEGQKVLKSKFPAFVNVSNELGDLRTIISNLRNSRTIRMMVQFGLLKKF